MQNWIDADPSEEKPPALPPPWKAGAIRTLIGVVVGAVVGLAFWKIPFFAKHDIFDNGMFFRLLVQYALPSGGCCWHGYTGNSLKAVDGVWLSLAKASLGRLF